MKRNLVLLLCVIAMVAICLASCAKDCEHTFGEDWYTDKNSHWHPATCEHGEIKDSLGEHIDEGEDGICDVCAFEMGHTHTYESTWQSDETHHWKNATCSHTNQKGENSLHSDEAKDGTCDVCSAHVHNPNAAGYCTHSDCGRKVKDVDESNVKAIIDALYVQQYLINSGHADTEMFGRSNHTTGGFNTHNVEIINYLFGKDGYTYKKVETTTTGESSEDSLMEGWYQPEDAENTFGMISYDGGHNFELDISDPNKLYGYYFTLSTIADGHGAEALLISLYDAVANNQGHIYDLVENIDAENNTVSFSFGILVVSITTVAVGDNVGDSIYNANYFAISGSFSYTDDFALTSLELNCDIYTNDPGALPSGEFNKQDVSLEYDPDTDTFKFVKYDEATDSHIETDDPIHNTYSFKITQTVGDRTEENPNPKSKFIPKSYELYLNQGDDGQLYNKFTGATIVATQREIINLYVSDYSPVGTSLHYAPSMVSFKLFLNGEEIPNVDAYDNQTAVAMFTFAGEQRSFFVIPKVKGVYRFEIYFMGELTHEVNINVGALKEDEITLKENEFAVRVTKKYEWANEVIFIATEAGTYTFHLPIGIGFINADGFDAAENTPVTDDTPTPYYDYNTNTNPDGSLIPGSFTLTLAKGESIRFYTMAVKNGAYVISYEVK